MTHCHQHRVRQWRSAARQYADRGSFRFSPRRATVPTYACSLLLRSFPVIDRQIVYRLPGRIFENPCPNDAYGREPGRPEEPSPVLGGVTR